MANPLLDDRDVAFVLDEVLDVPALTQLEAFAAHDREGFGMLLEAVRRVARDELYPAYKPLDEEPPAFVDGRVVTHPRMADLWRLQVDLGMVNATRPPAVGGMDLPLSVAVVAQAYLMAANLSAYGFVGLTAGAAHLVEAFGDDWTREHLMAPMYEGRWNGTMALTEPQAGSSLGDLTTAATPLAAADGPEAGTHLLRGAKIFISGGDQSFAENTVHLVLARIDGAPAGTRGISLFAVPRLRPEGGRLVDNDVSVTGVIHKIGWRGIPSLALAFGERGDCHGWLVGEPGQGLRHMFQMMNEARIMVGLNGVATASVAFQEALAYARERTQGRAPGTGREQPMSPIIEHADVRRMLLRQKAIVEGGFTLVVATARYADLAHAGADEAERDRAQRLLDLLTPVTKSFPAEYGFEANALAVQVHGGYGYSSEYPVEAWLRDQKLNTIHEGTTSIQSLDLLGRRVMADGGASLAAFVDEVGASIARARAAGVDGAHADALEEAVDDLTALTAELGGRGAGGDVEGMLRHSHDYLDLFSVVVVAWLHLARAAAVHERPDPGDFGHGVLRTTAYWFATEVPRVAVLADRIRSAEDSYAAMDPAWF